MPTITTDVLVVGAGPTGLAVAAKVAAAGIDVTVIDNQASGDNTSRAAVVHARTLEVLADLGVSARLVEEGIEAPRFTIRDRDKVLVPIRFDDLPSEFPYALMVSQAVTERILLERLTGLGGHVRRPLTLVDLVQDDSGVTATTDDGTEIRARYLVGADGMHSTVRDKTGIGFPGGSTRSRSASPTCASRATCRTTRSSSTSRPRAPWSPRPFPMARSDSSHRSLRLRQSPTSTTSRASSTAAVRN